jgi:serine protease Do
MRFSGKEGTMKKITLGSFAIIAVAVALLALFCHPARTPAAPASDGRIWTEGSNALPSAFPVHGFADLVEKLKPAVVNIYTTTIIKGQRFYRRMPLPFQDFFDDDLLRRFFGEGFEIPPQKRNSLGSGFIINADGYILTNNHVVAGATEIRVKLHSGKEYVAKVVGRDDNVDLALLKIEPKEKLPVVPLGDSDKVRVGDWVIAIGNPFGLAHTVTAGIVSAKDRVIGAGPFDDFIQTDASINPGNSGGPLFDTNGVVIGINTAIHAAGQGIGFAVPVNMAKKFVQDVLTKGRSSHGWLGVGIQELTPELASSLGVSVSSGVLVSQVFPSSPAEKAGIKRGDVIVAYNDKPVEQPSDLTRLVGTTPVGSKAKIKIVRGKDEVVLEATIGDRAEAKELAMEEGGEETEDFLGIKVAPVPDREANRLGLEKGRGVLVQEVSPDGQAAEAGIRVGDIILEVNRVPVSSPEQFVAEVSKVKSGDSALLLLLRQRNYFYVVVRKP